MAMSSLRNLTILQKVTLFNSFVAVKFNYISRVLPCPKTIAKGTQMQGRKFIWQGNIERMHQDRTPLLYIEGGGDGTHRYRRQIRSHDANEDTTTHWKRTIWRKKSRRSMFDDQTRTAYGCTDNTPILRTMPAGWKKVNSTLLRMREYETQNSKLATSSSIYQFLLAEKIQPPKIDVQDTKIKRLLKTTRWNTLGGWTKQFLWLHTHAPWFPS